MDKYYLPQNLDSPMKIILWTWDELLAFLIPFLIIFCILNSPISAVVIGVLVFCGLKKIKGEEGHYFIAHLAYWHLPPLMKYKSTPDSYVRKIFG
jgi:type IV conjugative transfer system protein TraL